MFLNYLKIAYRNLWNNKFYTLINFIGLGIAMAVVILIAVHVSFEMSYDKFHREGDHIYRISMEFHDTPWQRARTFLGVGPYVKENFDEIYDYTRICNTSAQGTMVFPGEDQTNQFIEKKTYYADSNIFEFFNFPLIRGNKKQVLNQPNTVVISKELAIKYFGEDWQNKPVIGETIKLTNFDNFTRQFILTGIFGKKPNAHFRPDMLMSMTSLPENKNQHLANKFHGGGFGMLMYSYVKVKEKSSYEPIISHLNEILHDEVWKFEFDIQFQSLEDIYYISDYPDEFEEGGDKRLTYLLIIVSLVVMICAWVNYMNLTIAQSLRRRKEVGVRKTIGANKNNLVFQFILEGLWVNLISGILAVMIAYLGLPLLDEYTLITDNDWPWFIWLEGEPMVLPFLLLLIGLVLIGALISGFYPALVMSSFGPAKALTGALSISINNKFSLRYALLSLQLVISAFLIICIFVVFSQLNYMLNKDLGFDKEQKLIVAPSIVNINTVHNYLNKARQFKNVLLNFNQILDVTSSSSVPGKIADGGEVLRKEPKLDIGMKNVYTKGPTPGLIVDSSFFNFYDIDLVAGMWFPKRIYDDTSSMEKYILVNEEFADFNGFENKEDLIGHIVYGWYFDENGEIKHVEKKIIGLVENFHQHSVKEAYTPMIFRPEGTRYNKSIYPDGSQSRYFSLNIQIGKNSKNDLPHLIGKIEDTWNGIFPELPFEYYFLDDAFNSQYKKDIRLSRVFGIFAALGIFISCLGLFGLSSFLIQQRTKEIGIRKVMGATLQNLFLLLSKRYIKLVLVAGIIAVPMAWWGINQWLENYAFRIEIRWWYFVIPLLALFVIAILTISFKIIRTAKANPVESLRYE